MKTQDKEFQGRSLDEAIAAACAYFDLPREKLEIDIRSDAKAGIFGLVGTRKASIVARPAPALESFSMSLQVPKGNLREEREGRESREGRENREGKDGRESREGRDSGRGGRPARDAAKAPRRDADAVAAADEDPDAADDGQLAFGLGRPDNEREAGEGEAAGDDFAAGNRPQPGNRAGQRERGGRSERFDRGRERGERGDRSERPERGRERGRPRRDGRPAPEGGNEISAESGRQEQTQRARSERPERRERDGRDRDQRERRQSQRRERDGRPASEGGRRERVLSQAASLEKSADVEDLDNDQRMAYEGLPETPLAELDQDKLLSLSREVMERMLGVLCPEAALSVSLGDERVDVTVDCEDAAALLIGREGQTLAAMQYMLTRIVGRGMGAAVNMHLDIGAYRQRQDDKLRELAVILAERARESGRAQFTRPLSSYHRRIVHLALQGESDLITRSKGEGALKRVSVAPRGNASGQRPEPVAEPAAANEAPAPEETTAGDE